MKLGILQAGHSADELRDVLGDYADLFKSMLGDFGFDFAVYDVVDNHFPSSPNDAAAWLITGSKHGAYEDHNWIPPLEDLIREIDQLKLPLVGICFGHQIIAQALGGKVEKFSGGWAVGHTEYTFKGHPVSLNAWHQDQVVQLPQGAKVLGSNAHCQNAMISYGDHIFTVQAHPEFSAAVVDGLATYRSATVPPELVERARSKMDQPLSNALLAKEIASVLKRKEPVS